MPLRGSVDSWSDGNTQNQAQLSAARGYFFATDWWRLHPRSLLTPIARPQRLGVRELPLQVRYQRAREHGDSVLVAFAFAHHDQQPVEVNILHSQSQGLHLAHSGTVEKPEHKLLLAGHGRQQLLHLGPAHHHRQALRNARAPDLLQPWQIHFEHLPVEEDQGSQGLPMGRRGDPSAIGQPAQKRLDLGRSHVAWVAQPMETDKPTHPVDIRALGAQTIVAIAQPLPNLVEQAGGAQGWELRGGGFHGWLLLYPCTVLDCQAPSDGGPESGVSPLLTRKLAPVKLKMYLDKTRSTY